MPQRDWKTLLDTAPKFGFKANLVRCISKNVFDGRQPPSYLFTSGRPGRCNPKGVFCLYMSEDRATALTEYDKYYSEPQPHIAFYGKLVTKAIIDLADSTTQAHFGFVPTVYFDSFRLKTHPTTLQRLGLEISRQSTVAGIRFPSAACHFAGTVGHNVVVYKNAFLSPNSLQILGAEETVLEEWP